MMNGHYASQPPQFREVLQSRLVILQTRDQIDVGKYRYPREFRLLALHPIFGTTVKVWEGKTRHHHLVRAGCGAGRGMRRGHDVPGRARRNAAAPLGE